VVLVDLSHLGGGGVSSDRHGASSAIIPSSSSLGDWDRCGLLDPFDHFPFASNNTRSAAARRQHSLEVEDEGRLKNFIVIFHFDKVLCIVRCFS
jgi:hypothetical protein